MPKKQKIDSRLSKLYRDFQPEEEAPVKAPRRSEPATDPTSGRPRAAPDLAPHVQVVQAPAAPVHRRLPSKRHTSALRTLPSTAPKLSGRESSLALTFQTGSDDWATLQIIDEATSRDWSEDEQLLVKQVAEQLSLALENARLFEETQRRAQETSALAEVGREISSTLNLEAVLDRIVQFARELLQAESSALYLPASNDGSWNAVAVVGQDAEEIRGDPIETGRGILGNIVLMRVGEIVNDASNKPQAITIKGTVEADFEHIMGVPILTMDRVSGLLAVWRTGEGKEFVASELEFLTNLARQAAIAIENARLFQETRQRSEELLKFRLGIERTDNAVFMTDVNGNIQYANEGFEKVYGYTRDETIGKTPRIIKSGLLPQEQYEQFWGTLLNKGTITGEIVNRSKDGRLLTIAGTNAPILDDQGIILGFLAVHADITEQKEAREIIRRRNDYLAASAEIGRLVTSTLDLNTIFSRTVNLIREKFGFYHAAIFIVEETGFNAVLREAAGPAGDELKKQRHSIPVESPSIVGKVTSTGLPLVVNNTALDPAHQPNPLLPDTRAEAALPLRVGNRIIGALDIQSTVVDAFTEDEIGVLQTLVDQVAVAIDNARSYELSQQAVKEMREIDRLKSQFLANMSHELRTPLNSIIGFSRVILKGIDGPVTELQQQDLTAIYNSGQHLLGLINDILDLSKIEAGKMELAFEEVNITDLTNSVLATMSGLIKDKPITLKRSIQPNLPGVRADAIRVRQVMINLLSNAAKFTEQGEISVEVAAKPGPAGQPELMVSVTDTGPGIAAADQPKLFQPFSQVDDSPTRKTSGSGLGLSISQHLIQMHGGRIGVHSTLGKGSSFYFTLPLHRRTEPQDASGPSGRLVLAIDDDPQVIGLYERFLQPQGYQVIALTDPSRAVERVRQLRPFAVTLDIMMPGIDGWQVLTSLKSDAQTRDTPVIVCSIVENQDRGYSLGAADYLVKPILEDELVSSLNRLNADGAIRKVLVVDDDPNDLRLFGKMLTDHGGFEPLLAEGGRRGWDMISSGAPPHAVVLDLFMPDLDGFKFLEDMRADARLRNTPVIVVTSQDLTPDQRKLLEGFAQRLLTKAALSEQELISALEHALDRVADSR